MHSIRGLVPGDAQDQYFYELNNFLQHIRRQKNG